jgi:PAS domain S-box-containing protein
MLDGSFRWHLSRAEPRRDPATGLLRWYGTATDIHDLRSTREALASTQSSLALALRAGRMGWWTRDLVSGIVTWSPELEEIFGLPPGGFQGDEDRFLSFVHPDDRHLVTDAVASALERRADYQVEFRFRHVDGSERWMEGRGRGLYDGDRPIGLTGVGIDITDRRAAAQLRDTFIGMLSHELRTPVTSIVGAGHMLKRPELPAATREELIEDVVSESQRLERLVENLLVLARAERGAVEGGHDPVLVRPILARVGVEQRRLMPGVTIAVEPMHDIPPVIGDEAAIELVIRNLVSNAAKYGPPDGTVRIRASRDDGAVRLEIDDEGPGLPPGDELRIFELFYRAPSARRTAPGAGIGLYVVRVLVEAMGGRITARNRAGGGASLVLRLPVYEDEDVSTQLD